MYNKFLKKFGYTIPVEDWNLSFFSHPSYPDINAVSETLDIFNIENIVAEVPFDLYDDLPDAFIALIIYDSQLQNVLVVKENLQDVKIVFPNNSTKKISKSSFFEIWTGVLLSIDQNPFFTTVRRKSKSVVSGNNIKYFLFGISLLLFIYINYSFNNFSIQSFIYCIVSFFGLGLSFLSLKESLGFESDLADRICSSGRNSNCDKIIFSRGAELINGVTMSDISFMYFLFSLIASFCFFLEGASSVLLLISLFSLPLLFYSIYYQYFKQKVWCNICLGISFLTILQITILLFTSHSSVAVNTYYLLIMLLSGIASIWLFVKPSFDKLGDLRFLEVDYNSITRRYDIFDIFFSESKTLTNLNNIKQIKLDNNLESKIKVIVILSPTCGACDKTYKEIKKMQMYYQGKIHVSIIFNLRPNLDEKVKAVFMKILDISHSENIPMIINALDDWFIIKLSEKKWLKKWKYSQYNHTNILENNNNFFNENELYNTPTIIINGHIYPMPYKLNELKYFMKEMEAKCK